MKNMKSVVAVMAMGAACLSACSPSLQKTETALQKELIQHWNFKKTI